MFITLNKQWNKINNSTTTLLKENFIVHMDSLFETQNHRSVLILRTKMRIWTKISKNKIKSKKEEQLRNTLEKINCIWASVIPISLKGSTCYDCDLNVCVERAKKKQSSIVHRLGVREKLSYFILQINTIYMSCMSKERKNKAQYIGGGGKRSGKWI